jgi:hypothetical protein
VPYYRFSQNDIIYNVLKTNPKTEFYIYQTKGQGGGVYYNNQERLAGQFTGSVPNASRLGDSGYVSLYEMNVDRTDVGLGATGLIKSFLPKFGTLQSFKTISDTEFSSEDYGTQIDFNYPLTASITRKWLPNGGTDLSTTGSALKNTLNEYAVHSKHYLFEYPEGVPAADQQWDKSNQDINLITIPSIFYGSSIKKGTVELNFYISGTLAAQLRDINKNGELIQVTGAANAYGTAQGSGSVAGVVLYNEGFILLTGSWDIDKDHEEAYRNGVGSANPKWIYWGIGAAEENNSGKNWNIASSSFGLKFSGSMEIPVLTMFAHAPKSLLNHSNNTTYIKHGQNLSPTTGAFGYAESQEIQIKNTTSSSYSDMTASFSKNTYISKIGIFDKDKNLLGFAKLATPVKKTEDRDLTFKLKLDI